jgi:SnoaL-like domain
MMCDEFAATQVVLREREARDRCWWTEMADCFNDESTVTISWFQGSGSDFVAQSKAMTERGVSSCHRLGPPTVRIRSDRGVVILPAVVETYPSVDGVACVLNAYCRLLYRVVRAAGVWKVAAIEVVYERDDIRPLVPGASIAIDDAELAGLRAPYRFVAWTMGKAGVTISQELPGDDRPAVVDALHIDAFTWAGIPWPGDSPATPLHDAPGPESR